MTFAPFNDFVHVAPVSEDTIATYSAAVEPAVVEMWQTQGYGMAAGGFLKVIDPDQYRMMIGDYLPRPDMVPLLATGMGDVVVAFSGKYRVLQYRYATFSGGVGSSLARLGRRAADVEYLSKFLAYRPYAEAASTYGALTDVADFEYVYGYKLPLPAGGPEDVDNLARVRIFEHVAFVAEIAGPLPFVG